MASNMQNVLLNYNGQEFQVEVDDETYQEIVTADASAVNAYTEQIFKLKQATDKENVSDVLTIPNCRTRICTSVPSLQYPVTTTENFLAYDGPAEGKTKGFWSYTVTKFMTNLRLSKEKEFAHPKCKKSKLWMDIAKEININFKNIQVSGEDCDNKYRNLMKTYKINKKKQGTTGESSITWEFFEDFDRVLGTKASVSPPQDILYDTLNEESDSSFDTTKDVSQEELSAHSINRESDEENIAKRKKTDKSDNLGKSEGLRKRKKIALGEYLAIKLENEEKNREENQRKEAERWNKEMEIKNREIDAILKLAEALGKK